jgi:AraC family transcriptional regulator of adaptative response/methylated-DNA-[protein]-cysteine methyltransferase
MNSFSPDDARWQAVLARDAARDGAFVYAVATTGIYCRPSCPSRRPKPENVRFHASAEDAETAGFRACKRCRPEDSAQHVDRPCPGLPRIPRLR